MSEIKDKLLNIYGSFKLDEARHAKPTVNTQDVDSQEEPEVKFQDRIAKKIQDLQATMEDLKIAIEKEKNAIKNGQISPINGQNKIDNWKSRLNSSEFKTQMLQQALDAYLDNQTSDNELKLKIAARKAA